ncbi:hypothetical protein [Bacillus sp. mrc49]|uniref:hypothetical protein n=1 Tax=Bacillus sp. mrc49 TaxID=2054913 RepID=UPI0012FD65ED|nr:hypothetical protein [Bacillus sp. mrc49]
MRSIHIQVMIISSVIYTIFPQPLTLGLFCTVGIACVGLTMRNEKNRGKVREQDVGKSAED